MVICAEQRKRDQNPKLTPLSETTSIPTPFICGVPSPRGSRHLAGGGGGGLTWLKSQWMNGTLAQGFWPLGTAITSLQRGGFPRRKRISKDICTEINSIKYKEEIQVITTVNEFLRFRTNLSNQHYANYHAIRRYMHEKIYISNSRTSYLL